MGALPPRVQAPSPRNNRKSMEATIYPCIRFTKDELVSAYEATAKYFKEHNINRPFNKYTEMFWILFDDGNHPYMWAIDTLCEWFTECNRQELEKTLERYI